MRSGYFLFLVIFLLAACEPRLLPSPGIAPSPPTTIASTATPATTSTTLSRAATPSLTAGMPLNPPYGVAGGDSIGDPYIPELGNTGYDVQAYNLSLDLDPAATTFDATVTITSTVALDNLGRLSLDCLGLDVHSVFVADQAVNFYQNETKVYIDLPRVYALGETLVIRVDYQGNFKPYRSPYMPGFELGITKPAANELLAFSEPDGARAWFPCNDHPLDKAEFHLQASVPAGLTAVSNGALLGTVPAGGKSTFSWYEDDALATYLVALAVGEYQRIDAGPAGDIQVRHYVFADDQKITDQLQRTPEILQFLTNLIGPYPFEEFGFVEIEPTDLAMETQSMIMAARNFWQKKDPSEILVHEAAHQWFGDHLSLRSWGETWLNEGLATYIQYLWLMEQGKPEKKLLSVAEAELLNVESEENSALIHPAAAYLFGVNPYLKGAWVVHMLRLEMGDDAFFALLKGYYQRFANGYVTTADFQSLAEEYSQRSLGTFFDQWTESPVMPHLDISWTNLAGPTETEVIVQVCQTQPGTPFVIPLELRFDADEGETRREVLQIDESQERFTLSLPFVPVDLVSDPDQKLLAGIQADQATSITPCPGP